MSGNDSELELDDIQGIVLSGYGELPQAGFLMLAFGDPGRARAWVGEVAAGIESAAAGRPGGGHRLHLAFTWAGLEHLELSWQALKGFSREFREGLAGSPRRSRILGDQGDSAPERWQWGGPAGATIHSVLMGYAATPEALDGLLEAQREALVAAGIAVVTALESRPLADGREHFGFRDGISQPKLAGVSSSRDPRHTVAAGEFILGYPNERDQVTMRPLVDPIEDPDNLLPEVAEDSDLHDLGRNGSYLVFRQLGQDVHRFWSWLDAATPDAGARVALAARMVGRWPDGEPLVKAPERPVGEGTDNDFGYHHEDADGLKCPLGAHIRRTNPRDMLPPKPGSEDSLAINRRHRLLRRGRAYGPPLAESLAPDDLLAADDDGLERGLHFLCLNADISRQFEFVQHTWAENPNFAGLHADTDPLVGARGDGRATFTVPGEPVRRRHHDLPRFVRVHGGAYFFVPGLRALRYLAAPPRRLTSEISAPAAPAILLPDTWWLRTGRTLNRALEAGVSLSRRATRLRNGLDRLVQRPATDALQGWILRRRRKHAIDADLAIAEERRLAGEEEVTRRITEQMSDFLLRTYRRGTAEQLLAGIFILSHWVLKSRFGKVIEAIRDGEPRVRFLGYRTDRYKVALFVYSAMIAGVAGALYVPQVGIINPGEFAPLNSIEIVVWVAVGGRGTLYGAVIGALLVNYAKTRFTAIMPDGWLFMLGALFVLVTLFLPKGLAGVYGQLAASWKRNRRSEEPPQHNREATS